MGPRSVIASFDGFQPSNFCRETCTCMQVADDLLGSWQVIHICDALLGLFIKEDVFRLVRCNIGLEGHTPEAAGGVPPPSENRLTVDALEIILVVVNEDFVGCEHRDIPRVCKLAGAEQRVMVKVGYDVDRTRWLSDKVM